jgi:hypothetical protein
MALRQTAARRNAEVETKHRFDKPSTLCYTLPRCFAVVSPLSGRRNKQVKALSLPRNALAGWSETSPGVRRFNRVLTPGFLFAFALSYGKLYLHN